MRFVDADDEVPDARQISVLARHEAALDDGRRVLLMDDRGWSESGPPNIWVETSVQEIVDTTRAVVGPDEPFGGRSHQDMEAEHWAQSGWGPRGARNCCGRPGPEATTHNVVLSERLLARIGQTPTTPSNPDPAYAAGPSAEPGAGHDHPARRARVVRGSPCETGCPDHRSPYGMAPFRAEVRSSPWSSRLLAASRVRVYGSRSNVKESGGSKRNGVASEVFEFHPNQRHVTVLSAS